MSQLSLDDAYRVNLVKKGYIVHHNDLSASHPIGLNH